MQFLDDEMPLHMVWIRHGEYDGNLHVVSNPDRLPLNSTGIGQITTARRQGRRTGLLRLVDRVYTSPLARAIDTGETLFPFHRREIIDELRERSIAHYEGIPLGEILKRHREFQKERNESPINWRPKDGESLNAVIHRVLRGLKKAGGVCPAFCVHGDVMWSMRCEILGVDDDDMRAVYADHKTWGIYNGEIDIYTRVNPRTGRVVDDFHEGYFRSICFDPPRDTGWLRARDLAPVPETKQFAVPILGDSISLN